MPSTTDERRALMENWFGYLPNADCDALKVLESKGFIEIDGLILKPTQARTLHFEEVELILFLVQEWDYGFEDRAPSAIELEKFARSRRITIDSSN